MENGRGEVFVPGWYRPAAIAQALVPGLLSARVTRLVWERLRGVG